MVQALKNRMTAKSRAAAARALVGDLAGGTVAALIALPYGLAMATAMGLPPLLGVLTSILTAPAIAVLGRNPVLIGGVSSVTVPVIAQTVRERGPEGLAQLSIMAAVIMLLFGAARLGRYVAKIPMVVIAGFSCGIGSWMIISQLKTIFGASVVPAQGGVSVFSQLLHALRHAGDVEGASTGVACTVIIAAALCAKLDARLPAPLFGICVAMLVAQLAGWEAPEVGALPLAPMPSLTNISFHPATLMVLLPQAFSLAFVSSINTLMTARVVNHFRGRHGKTHKADADHELKAYGCANLLTGVFGAPVSVGIPARSLANVRCGGTTRLSNIFHALFLLFSVTAGASLISHVPLAALAGVTAWMGFCLMEWGMWRRLPKMRRADAAAFLATAFGALYFNAIVAVAAGCCLCLLQHFSGDGHLRNVIAPLAINRQRPK